MNIKTKELIGVALDWAVAKAAGELECVVMVGTAKAQAVVFDLESGYMFSMRTGGGYSPSTSWKQAGSIIEHNGITITTNFDWNVWRAYINQTAGRHVATHDGTTPLIAAMRCYVASKLGDVVEIPEELL